MAVGLAGTLRAGGKAGFAPHGRERDAIPPYGTRIPPTQAMEGGALQELKWHK